MDRRRSDTAHLRVIDGGLVLTTRGSGVRAHLSASPVPPFPVDAMLVEEDTHFVLSAPARLPEEPEHPIRLMTDLVEARAAPLGTVVVRGGQAPYRLLAVVHDVERSPTWCEEWIVSALHDAVAAAERLGLRRLATPVLGAGHGTMDPGRFCELLRAVLAASLVAKLERCWILLPPVSPAERRRLERVLVGSERG